MHVHVHVYVCVYVINCVVSNHTDGKQALSISRACMTTQMITHVRMNSLLDGNPGQLLHEVKGLSDVDKHGEVILLPTHTHHNTLTQLGRLQTEKLGERKGLKLRCWERERG